MKIGRRLIWLIALSYSTVFAQQVQALREKEIHIPAGNLASAVEILKQQTGVEIAYDANQVREIRSKAVDGNLAAGQALKVLLEGTHLVAKTNPSGTIRISASAEKPVAMPSRHPYRLAELSSDLGMEQATGQNEEPSSSLGEITVTARKRQESLFDVPVVASVIGGQAIEQAEIHDLATLQTRIPGLLVANGSEVDGPGISIRGIGTTVSDATVDQSVSLNVDGLQLSQAFAYDAALFDVGQVEVLKGPQALFFGKNSPAGVISVRTADPTDQFEAIARGGYEAVAQGKLGEVILSGPVNDALKLRLAVHYYDDNGFFKNLDTAPEGFGLRSPTTNQYAADQDIVVRTTALFNPSDMYEARLKFNYIYDFEDYGSGDTQMGYCPGGRAGLVSFTGLPVFDPNEDCTVNRNFYFSWPALSGYPDLGHGDVPYGRSTSEFGTLEQNVHFGAFTATSVTGVYIYDQRTLVMGSDGGGIDPFAADVDFGNHQFTEEVRLASEFHSPVNFTVGAFYQDSHMRNHVALDGDVLLGLPSAIQNVIHDISVDSISSFGEVTWNVVDKLELAGGARVTHETRGHTEDNFAIASGPLGPTPTLEPSISSTDVSPEATLTYKASDEVHLFGSFKEGFKSGSFNSAQYFSPTTQSSFGDEKVKSGEVGLKSRLLDNRLTLNLAGYYARYSGLQVGAIETTSEGALALQIVNAAAATTKGIDFDANYAPAAVEGLSLSLGMNYNHARYASFLNAPCAGNQTISQGCNQLYDPSTGAYSAQDLTGKPLSRAPDWTITPGINYEANVGQKMTLTSGANVLYVSKYYNNVIDLPAFSQSAFAKANVNIALKGANDAWEVALLGNNIADKITSSACNNANESGALIFGGQVTGKATGGPAGPDYGICAPDRGREIWLRITVRPFNFAHR